MKRRFAAFLTAILLLPGAAQAAFVDPRDATTLTDLREKARKGDPAAVGLLGWALRYGVGVEKNQNVALQLMQMSAQSGHPYGLFLLCEASDDGWGQPRDAQMAKVLCTQALPGLQELSLKDSYAQYMLGYLFDHGLGGLSPDPDSARRWYKLAAAQGHPFAMNNLGFLYAQEGDHAQAMPWFERAAAQGIASAQVNLGYAYQHGQGVAQNFATALKWYKAAAEQGDASAQNNLASLHAEGQGVAKDAAQAVYWYRQAADQGYPIAQYNLGLSYLLGQGVGKDQGEALRWLVRAAEQDLPEAQYEAGRILLEGDEALRNQDQARMWLQKATSKGHRQARDLLMRRFKGPIEEPS